MAFIDTVTSFTLKRVFFRTAGNCHFCGDKLFFSRRRVKRAQPEKGAWEVDHVSQTDKGGKNTDAGKIIKQLERKRLMANMKRRVV
jgi:hypothetical protein